jgi:hypothetical protein
MKKFWLFTAILIFLASVGWGQTVFYYTGDGTYGDWYDINNWKDAATGGSGLGRFPGDGSTTDIVIINTTVWNMNINNDLTLQELIINTGGSLIFNNNDLTVTNLTFNHNGQFLFSGANIAVTDTLELNGLLDLDTNTSSIDFANLKIGAGAGTAIGIRGSTATMHGAPVQVSPDSNQGNIIFNPVTDKLGNIDAGDRNITITIPPGSNVTVDDISSNGNITVTVGGGSVVDMGSITAGGNVTINAGAGSTVIVSEINPTPTITGGGTVIDLSSSNVYEWNGDVNTIWTNDSNWSPNSPGVGDPSYIIIINDSPPNYPVFSGGTLLTCYTLSASRKD